MNKEIELKFGVNEAPELNQYNDIKIYRIRQNYIYQDYFSAIRTREIHNFQSNKNEYIYTVKTKGDIKNNNSIYEIERQISEEEYMSISNNGLNIIEKCRIKIPIENNLIAEMDLYYGDLNGLITVEVEFTDEREILNFTKPLWFGDELNKKVFSNANLSKMNRNQFLKILSNAEIERNMKIKSFIEQYLNIEKII